MRSFACSVILSAVLLVPLAGCGDDAETDPGTTAGAAGTVGGAGAGASGKSGSSGQSTGGKSGASGKGGSAGAGDVGGSGGDAGGGDTGGTSAGVAGASGESGASGANAGGTSAGAGAGGASAGANAGGTEAGGTDAGSGGTDAGSGGTDAGSGGTGDGGTDGGAGAGTGGTESAGGAGQAGSDSAGGSGGSAAGAAGTDAGGAAGTGGGSGASGQGGGPGQRLRIMASNLTSGTKQTYEDIGNERGPGMRMLKGSHPDVVLMQEFNYGANTTAAIATLTEYVLGEPGHFYRESLGQNGAIPNGIISRYPIVASGSWVDKQVANRQFAWARIAIPGAHELWAVSVHLLTKNESTRNTQAKALVDLIAANVPADDYLVLGGDFNTDVRTETCVTTFGSQLVVGPLFPLDMAGNGNTSVKRNKPYDWVLGDSDLDKLAIPVVIGANVFPGGFVVDTKSYTPISDLAPALATDSLDTVNGKPTYMQHLGVVRDFWIPVP